MNAGTNSNRLLNSLIPMGANSSVFTNSKPSWFASSGLIIFSITLILFLTILYFFKDTIQSWWNSSSSELSSMLGLNASKPSEPSEPSESSEESNASENTMNKDTDVTNPVPRIGEEDQSLLHIPKSVESVLPGREEVFNISSNRYTYYDAEPLCKSLGAELATYDQVKEAWAKGADWCNYGWVKGQMAVYPTSDDTYKKLQGGPADQQLACGRPGLNGGYFDNPEMRFGANCYGKKPPQSKHDEQSAAKATPVSPDALAFDKKVAQFKSESDTIGILPFNTKRWE